MLLRSVPSKQPPLGGSAGRRSLISGLTAAAAGVLLLLVGKDILTAPVEGQLLRSAWTATLGEQM